MDSPDEPIIISPTVEVSKTLIALVELLIEDVEVPIKCSSDKSEGLEYILEVDIPYLQLAGAGATFDEAVDDLKLVISDRLEQASLLPGICKEHLEMLLKLKLFIEAGGDLFEELVLKEAGIEHPY